MLVWIWRSSKTHSYTEEDCELSTGLTADSICLLNKGGWGTGLESRRRNEWNRFYKRNISLNACEWALDVRCLQWIKTAIHFLFLKSIYETSSNPPLSPLRLQQTLSSLLLSACLCITSFQRPPTWTKRAVGVWLARTIPACVWLAANDIISGD